MRKGERFHRRIVFLSLLTILAEMSFLPPAHTDRHELFNMFEPLPNPFVTLHSVIQSTRDVIILCSCNNPTASRFFVGFCSLAARRHGSFFRSFPPIFTKEPSTSIGQFGLVLTRSCDTKVTSMGRQTDALCVSLLYCLLP